VYLTPVSVIYLYFACISDRLFGLVARVPGYRSRGPGLIPGATRFSEKYLLTSGGCSVGIVPTRTQAMEFSLVLMGL
jgi:hypothetical protein